MHEIRGMHRLNQPSQKFLDGFKYELDNRAFARRAISRIKDRLKYRFADEPQLVFWESYHELELLNERRYREAAEEWGLDFTPGWWPRLRAWVVGHTPKPLLGRLIGYVYPQTVDYLVELKRLQSIGPVGADSFLNYMVDQEVLQLEMMRLALEDRYDKIPQLLSSFLWKYRS